MVFPLYQHPYSPLLSPLLHGILLLLTSTIFAYFPWLTTFPYNHCASPSPFYLPLLSFIIPPLFILQIYSQVYSNVVKDWEISEDTRRLKYAAMKKEIRKGAGFSLIRYDRHLFTVACRSNMRDKGVLFGMFYMVYCRYKVTPHRTTPHHTTPHCTTPHHTTLHCTALHSTAPHCTTLHCTAQHSTAL